MNWYRNLKIAQLISQPKINTFSGKIIRMYELEYKLYGVKNFNFLGVEKRKENIQENLEKQLLSLSNQIKRILLSTFKSWLSSHALLSPGKWAEERTNNEIEMDYDFSGMILDTIFEYNRYANENSLDILEGFQEILNTMMKNIDEFPTFKNLIELFDEEYKQNEIDTLNSEGYEEYSEIMGRNFNNYEEALNYINNETDSFELFSEYTYNLSSFQNMIELYGIDERKIVKEINKNLVFPEWFKYWQAAGIEETRENVENAYKILKSAKNINELIYSINHAINTSHQTGSMVEHIGNNIGEDSTEILNTLQDMTNGVLIPEWNKELKEAGFMPNN